VLLQLPVPKLAKKAEGQMSAQPAGKQALPSFKGPSEGQDHLRRVLDVMELKGGTKLALNGSKRGKRVYTLLCREARMEILVKSVCWFVMAPEIIKNRSREIGLSKST
jgi:hypothetical protein